MKRRFLKRGVTWVCPTCQGRTATVPMLRRVVGRRVIEGLWRSSDVAPARDAAHCPSCRHPMREVEVHTPEGAQTLDTCRRCHFIWFDPHEYHTLLRHHVPDLADVEAVAVDQRLEVARTRLAAQTETSGRERSTPDEGWKWLPGLLGMPVEFDGHPLRHRPWMTWILLSLISALGIVTMQNLQPIVDRYGFLASDPWRLSGMTLLTSFFLHAGWLHLVGNAYFLWVFGDNSEDTLGVPRYVLLILLATVLGDLAHLWTTQRPDIPCIGASGGISGVIAYYALRFPRVRLGLLFYWFFWLRISALTGLILWVILQLVGAWLLEGNVAYTAHLGGAAAGLLFWLLDRDRPADRRERTSSG